MTAYILDEEVTHNRHKKRPAIIICPGGGYIKLAHRESEPVVMRLLGMGYNVFLLRYSVYLKKRENAQGVAVTNPNFNVFDSYLDLEASLKIIAEKQKEWFIDTNYLYLMGFSAGAHYIAYFMEHQKDYTIPAGIRIKGLIMSYPMINVQTVNLAEGNHYLNEAIKPEDYDKLDLLQHVTEDFPRTFIWQGGEDKTTSPIATTKFFLQLKEHQVPCELHLFETGQHGVSLADETVALTDGDIDKVLSQWIKLLFTWLKKDQGPVVLYPDERE